MKLMVMLVVGCAVTACATKRENNDSMGLSSSLSAEDSALQSQVSAVIKTVEARVMYEPFVNKAGVLVEGVGDYFLVYNDLHWFIKFTDGTVLREDIAKLKDQTAKFVVMEKEGLWDTDDPNVQSRVGKYVGIYEIIKN